MIQASFNIGILTLIFFVIGMIKPQWPLFFMKKPDRFWVLIISTILFMVAATLFGEGNRRAELEAPSKYSLPEDAAPVPEATPAKPAQ